VVDQDREDDEAAPANQTGRKRFATSLIIVTGVGSGVIAVVSPTVGAALGVVVTVLVALDELARSHNRRTRR
jgi:hypothetical protein